MLHRGYDYKDIIGLSSKHLATTVLETSQKLPTIVKDPQICQQEAQKKLTHFPTQPTNTYLQKRGISSRIYEKYSNLKVNQTATLFPLYQSTGLGKAQLCSTITYQMDQHANSSKYFQKGLPRGLSLLQESSTIKQLVITESPIDALSHRQLHQGNPDIEKTRYICTCGSISKNIQKNIEQHLKTAKAKNYTLTLAFDNDAAGKKMTQQIAALAQSQNLPVKISLPPLGKDWNETLSHQVGKLLQLDQELSKHLSPTHATYQAVFEKLCKHLSIQQGYTTPQQRKELKYFQAPQKTSGPMLASKSQFSTVVKKFFEDEHEFERTLTPARARKKTPDIESEYYQGRK